MARYIDDPIAERELLVMGQPGRRVTVRLARPELASDMPGVWQCRYQIEGLDAPCEERACGDDSMATIVNSFIGIRRRLGESGLRWCWPDGTEADTGFPRYVPDFGDRSFTREIERYIDERMERYVREREARQRGQKEGDEP